MKKDTGLLNIFEEEEQGLKSSRLSGAATMVVGASGLAFTASSIITSIPQISNKAIIAGSSIAIVSLGLFKYANNHKNLEELKEIKKMILNEYNRQLNNLESNVQENNDLYNLVIEELKQNKLVKKLK